MNDPRRPPFLDSLVATSADSESADAEAAAGATPTSPWPVISSEALLNGSPCVYIEHAGGLYVLRATRSGKLILTK